jgi:peptide/nickel transport system substrate-binding protein
MPQDRRTDRQSDVSYWDRYTRARMSRRTLLHGAATTAVAAGAIAIAGCSSSDSGAKSSGSPTAAATPSAQPEILNPGGTPRRGGRFVTANSATFGTFDPHLGIQVASAYFPRVYNVLLNQSATRPEWLFMDLARSYETPDDTTYIFKIRPGVRIAPNDLGVPERDLDAEDVRVTLERIRTDSATTQYSFGKQHISSASVSGDTVTVKTPEPYAWFLNRIGLFLNCIAPRELLAGDLSRLTAKAAGAGPYRLVELTEGEHARFDANPNYYRKDEARENARLPYVDGLDVKVIFDRVTQRTAFQSGQIHMYWAAGLADAQSLGGRNAITNEPGFAYISMTMNPRRPPFDDPRVRRAISRAINRQEYVDRVYKGDARADGVIAWSLGAYALSADELDQTYQPFDLEEAKQLVQQVGGIRFKMMYPAGTTIEDHGAHLPIFLGQMANAGIQIDQDPQSFAVWIGNYHEMNYDCSLALNQLYETPELPLLMHTGGGPFGDNSYIQGLGDPDIEAAVKKANTQLDVPARIEAVHDAQKVIYDKDPIMLPLVTPVDHYVYPGSVRNITTGIGTSNYLLNDFWLDA